MEWDDLRYVLATARSGSFFGASRLLKVSHTTVGRRIKVLEDDLGKPLFRRTRDGCEPTEAVLRLMPVAERVEREMREVGRLAAGVSEEPAGLVELHTAAWILRRILIPALPDFYAAFPSVRLNLVGDVVESAASQATSLITLRFSVMAGRTEIEASLADVNYSVYGPSGQDPDTLPWLTTYGGHIAMSTHSWLTQQGVSTDDVPFLANDADLLAAAIGAGVGKGLIPDLIGQPDPRLTRLTRGGPALVRTLRSLVPRHVVNRAEVRVVLDWVEDAVTQAAMRQ